MSLRFRWNRQFEARLMIAVCFCLFVSTLPSNVGFAQLKSDRPQWPTVGATTEMVDVVIPGPKLTGKPIDGADPVIVRVTDAIAHGDGFRYRIEYQGMEPGNFDLAKWLVKKGSLEETELPAIPVQIRSLLPPGQIQPNDLTDGWLPRMGGYNVLISLLALLWTLGLLGLIFLGRPRKQNALETAAPTTLSEMLKQRIQTACDDTSGEASSKELAELERMLTAFWQRKLNLESEPPHQAIAKIRQHADSGPLMQRLEAWIHRPDAGAGAEVDWKTLLEPYRDLPADSLDSRSSEDSVSEAKHAVR